MLSEWLDSVSAAPAQNAVAAAGAMLLVVGLLLIRFVRRWLLRLTLFAVVAVLAVALLWQGADLWDALQP
ncbi:MAG: hypothetical protein OXE79_02850 [Acidimicrobiaceae bacterium]|nr:hypothetical protein [Acidimicrobiaceae bacterium]MCY4293944.1 hypothetical protein [Acidimicrobiaceae bacterium]